MLGRERASLLAPILDTPAYIGYPSLFECIRRIRSVGEIPGTLGELFHCFHVTDCLERDEPAMLCPSLGPILIGLIKSDSGARIVDPSLAPKASKRASERARDRGGSRGEEKE